MSTTFIGVSFLSYFIAEATHGYELNEDEKLFSDKQRRVTTFMKTPRELEKVTFINECRDHFLWLTFSYQS